jgi:hypothetical protein
MSAPNLLPCPFCGQDLVQPYLKNPEVYRHPENVDCFANKAIIHPESYGLWNTRAAALEAVKAQEWNRALEWAARIIEAMWDDASYGSQSAAVLYDAKHAIRAGKVQP